MKTTARLGALTRHSKRRRLVSAAMAIAAAAGSATVMAAAPDFNCLIEPSQVVEIRSPVVGLLQDVRARRGESITRGQVLATIESSVEQSAAATAGFRAQAEGALLLARSRLAAAREKARRMAELFDEEFVSAQARDDAAAEARTTEAELKTAEENAQLARLEHRQTEDQLKRRLIRSPFDGVVVDQYLYPGAMVDTGDNRKPIMKIAQTHPLAVQAILPFSYFARVKVGTPVQVIPEAPLTREIAARVTTVDRVVDAAAGTFGIVVSLPNARQDLPGGIRCKLRLQAER